MEDNICMITDNDYKRELERFLGYKLGFESFLGKKHELCLLMCNR